MNKLERFKAVVHFEKPDCQPLLTMEGGGYIVPQGLAKLHDERLPHDGKIVKGETIIGFSSVIKKG